MRPLILSRSTVTDCGSNTVPTGSGLGVFLEWDVRSVLSSSHTATAPRGTAPCPCSPVLFVRTGRRPGPPCPAMGGGHLVARLF